MLRGAIEGAANFGATHSESTVLEKRFEKELQGSVGFINNGAKVIAAQIGTDRLGEDARFALAGFR